MVDQEEFDDIYEDYLERKEKKDKYKGIPIKLIVVLGISAIVLLLIFVKQEDNNFLWIVGLGVAAIIVLSVLKGKSDDDSYIDEPKAFKILERYLNMKKDFIPRMKGKVIDLTVVCQRRERDSGKGMAPWCFIIPWDLVGDNYKRERFLSYIDPKTGQVIGTEMVDTVYFGKEKAHIRMIPNLDLKMKKRFNDESG